MAQPSSSSSPWSRLVLPAVLAGAFVAAWIVSATMGDLTVEPAAPDDDERAADDVMVPLASVRRLPSVAATSLRSARIDLVLDGVPTPDAPLACAVVMVDGEVAHDFNGDTSLAPGPAQLLLTGMVALDVLGPSHTFETRAMVEALPDDGRLRGDLYLVGGGDPVLMSYSYARSFRPIQATYTPIEELADAVAGRGIDRIDGAIIGVERRYDTTRGLPGWPGDLFERGRVGPLSALQLDDGFAERPGANQGVAIAADDPAAMTAERFDDLLEAADVTIDGLPRSAAADDELPELVPLGAVRSAPLSDIIFQMWAVNDASAAEMLMKEVGVVAEREGSTQAGGDAVQRWFDERGVELPVAPRDGSGADPLGSTTCRLLAGAAEVVIGDAGALATLPTHTLPGIYGGAFTDVQIDADLRVVGGSYGQTSSLVATTADDGPNVTIVTIINRRGGEPTDDDVAYQRQLIALTDAFRAAWADIDVAPEGDS